MQPVTEQLVKNVLQAIASRAHVTDHDDQPKWLGKDDSGVLLAFENGLVAVDALRDGSPQVTGHSPEWFSAVCFDYDFDPNAVCSHWLRFLDEVLEADTERIALLQEFMGLSLVFDMQFQRFLVMIGAAGAGKSVIAEVWTALLGPDHVSNVPLERFGDRFALHGTLGKLMNFSHEPGPMTPSSENVLKAITGQDRLTVEQKYKSPFAAYMTTRVVVLTNNLPSFTDRSFGIWRRALFLPFNVAVPVDRQDKGLANKLKRELPGIFNWAWQGYMRLLERQEFTMPTASRIVADEFLKDANPTREFLETRCAADAEADVAVQTLYATYRTWADERGHRALNERQFGQELHRMFPGITKQRRGPRERRAYMYVGVRLTEPA